MGCTRPFTILADNTPSVYCEECLSTAPEQRSQVIINTQAIIANFDRGIQRAELRPFPCCKPGCNVQVFPASGFAPACSAACQCASAVVASSAKTQDLNPLRAGLQALGRLHMTESIKASTWKTYATGTRHWIRFRLGVQRRHPCQVVKGTDPMELEHDAEESLIEFVEWLSLAGTVAPATAGDYVSAVKAAHLLWTGYPYEAITSTRFFRLGRVLSGLRKTTTMRKKEVREGLLHSHHELFFQLHDQLERNHCCYSREYFADESVSITLWQAILRPAEVLTTDGNPVHANWTWITFRDRLRRPMPYSTPYFLIESVEIDLREGRKNDAEKTNPPIILAADHDASTERFSACFQLHRAINFMHPTPELLQVIPLFPQCLIPDIGNNLAAAKSLISHTDSTLTTMIRSKCAIIFNKEVKDPSLAVYTGYSLRIGGAIALHDAGADGMVIAALGQWRSDVYQIYIRTARHKAMSWTVRMSRGYKAVF